MNFESPPTETANKISSNEKLDHLTTLSDDDLTTEFEKMIADESLKSEQLTYLKDKFEENLELANKLFDESNSENAKELGQNVLNIRKKISTIEVFMNHVN